MNNLIDTHLHLDCCKNHQEIYRKINESKQYTLCVTNTPEAFERCISFYPETKYVKFALGFNPQCVVETKFDSFKFMKNIKKARYIGEVGLDFTKPYVQYKEEQIKIFDFICKIAANNNRIMSVHSRGAEEEVLEILERNNVRRAILHWYTGEVGLIERIIEDGYYFSVNSRMIKKESIYFLNKYRILTETDAPFTIDIEENYIKYSKILMQTYLAIKKIYTDISIIDNFRELLEK